MEFSTQKNQMKKNGKKTCDAFTPKKYNFFHCFSISQKKETKKYKERKRNAENSY